MKSDDPYFLQQFEDKILSRLIVLTGKTPATEMVKSQVVILIISFYILGFEMCNWVSQSSGKKLVSYFFSLWFFGYIFIL